MQTVIIVIHLMVIVALVAVVLLQRSEGGALGMGGSDQFMTMRGQGNVLTRAAAILGAIFFATSLAMSVLNRLSVPPTSILDTTPAAQTAPNAPANGAPATAPANGGKGILDQLNKYTSGPPGTVPQKSVVPDTGTPPAPAGSQPATGGAQAPAPATGSQPAAPAGSQPAPAGTPAPAQ